MLGLISKIEFTDGTIKKTGYDANILPAMCELYLQARREKKLTKQQLKLATQAEILQSAFARVGIQALIDEATGLQYDRKNDALRYLLQQYISSGTGDYTCGENVRIVVDGDVKVKINNNQFAMKQEAQSSLAAG